MGIDPGLASTGIGVIEEQAPQSWKALFHGAVRTAASAPMPTRLARIHEMVGVNIEEYRPEVIAVESIFFAKNARSAVQMAHGRGVAIMTAAQRGIEVVEYSPLEIKQSVVGKGRAGKEQVQHMVAFLLSLRNGTGSDHEADALACALCHAFRWRMNARLAPADPGNAAQDERKALLAQSRRGRKRR